MSDSNTKVITGRAILSYPHLHQPQPGKNGQQPKYSSALLFTPELLTAADDRAAFEAMQKAAIAAAIDFFGPTIKTPAGPIPTERALRDGLIRSPFRKDGALKGYPEGTIFINARTTQRPGVVYAWKGADGKPEKMPLDRVKDEMYPGVIVRASLAAFGYDQEGNKGVSFALNNLQKLADGERIDGRVAAEDEFDASLSAPPVDISGLV